MKLCRDCKWCRPADGWPLEYAQCAAPALVSKPDPITGVCTMGLCRYLRRGGPLDLFGSFFAPCGKQARHFEPADPLPAPATPQEETP